MKNYFSFKNIAIISLATITISGCKLFRPYESPEWAKTTPQLYRDQSANQDTTTIAQLSWTEFFSDTTLLGLIKEGLTNNYDLKNAILQIQQANASLLQSKLAFLPNLNFAPQITHNHASKASLNFPDGIDIRLNTTTAQFGFTSNWELDVWGKLASGKRSAFAKWLQADATRKAIQTSLVANISRSYYTLLALDEQLAITEATLALREKTINTMKALKEAAIVNGAAVVQSEANYFAAKASIPDLQQAIRELEHNLCILLGKPMQAIPRGKWNNARLPNQLSIGVPTQLLAYRPDVIAAEQGFRAAFEMVNVAKTQFYPSFTLTSASAGISALTHKDLFSNSIFYNIVGGLTQPLLNRGTIRANHKISIAQQEQALNTFEKTLLVAGQEVSNALFSYETSIKKADARKQQIVALEKAVNFTMQLLEYTSTTNYTDVLTSEQSLLTAKLSAVNDQLQQYQATIELYRSLGGGWN